MKILPDYLIEYMPELEEAIEELRLSVMDHAYELLKCLDIDELSTDDIRRKLELYDIKVENMTDAWLPNGRFYRIYPSIKHNRSRLNGIKSIVQSGGQFEGLWSDDFSGKIESNYKNIQLLRHYTLRSDYDGYFYISGDTSMDSSGAVTSAVIHALTSDILLDQALPAGYTYLYVPWPRPHYPTDSGYFYAVHMLHVDRLHYAIDCSKLNSNEWKPKEGSDRLYVRLENSSSNRYYDIISHKYGLSGRDPFLPLPGDVPFLTPTTDAPASMSYGWYNSSGTPYKTPYWFDYHYMDDMRHADCQPLAPPFNPYIGGGKWPIVESGRYYDKDGYEITDRTRDNLDLAIKYVLNDECKELGNSNAVFATKCFIRSINKTTAPNRDDVAGYTPLDSRFNIILSGYSGTTENIARIILNYRKDIDFADAIDLVEQSLISPVTVIYYIDEFTANKAIEDIELQGGIADKSAVPLCLDEFYSKYDTYTKFGPYRFDHLCSYGHRDRLNQNHIKTYKPIWSEESPIFALMQSTDVSSLDGSIDDSAHTARYSMFNWFNAKQYNNVPKLSNVNGSNVELTDSIVKSNSPEVSKVTFTSYNRPTVSHLDTIYIGYLRSADDSQGDNESYYSDVAANSLYAFGDDSPERYDPSLAYSIFKVFINENNAGENYIEIDDPEVYVEGDPSNNHLYVNGKSSQYDVASYITYKTSKVHKLWLSPNKVDTEVQSSALYNAQGSDEIYYYSCNDKRFAFTILGVYTANGTKIDSDNMSITCMVGNSKYHVRLINSGSSVSAAYVTFTVKVYDGESPTAQVVSVFNQSTGLTYTADYDPIVGSITFNGQIMTMADFYSAGYIIKKYSQILYYGEEALTVYYDDLDY